MSLIKYKLVLESLIAGQDLSYSDMLSIMQRVMQGELTSAQIAGFLIALRIKGESVDEITAAATVMRALSTKVQIQDKTHLIDTCGTGGDGIQTFNVSTISAFVAAAAGAKVAKHGGRSVSSTCGSADVLETLGVNVNLTPEQVADCVNNIGIGFMFAPNHHSAMKHSAPVRRELGVRTLFNLLGPLTNPANAKRQVMGVFTQELTLKLAKVLQNLGSEHVLVVHGADGMDEISFTGDTSFATTGDVIASFFLSTGTGTSFCFGGLLFSTSTAVILSFPPASLAASTSAFAFAARFFFVVNTDTIVPELIISVRPSLHNSNISSERKGDSPVSIKSSAVVISSSNPNALSISLRLG